MSKMDKEYSQRDGGKEVKYKLIAEGKNDNVLFGVYRAVESNDNLKKLKQGALYTIETKTIPELINCKDTPSITKTFNLDTEDFRKRVFSDTTSPEALLAMVTDYYRHQDVRNKTDLLTLLETACDLVGVVKQGN